MKKITLALVIIGIVLCSAVAAYMPLLVVRECPNCKSQVVQEETISGNTIKNWRRRRSVLFGLFHRANETSLNQAPGKQPTVRTVLSSMIWRCGRSGRSSKAS
jgi:hypothetical protein